MYDSMTAVNAAVFLESICPPHPPCWPPATLRRSAEHNAARSSPTAEIQAPTAAPRPRGYSGHPLAVHASTPKKGTKTPCGGVIFVSIRIPHRLPCPHRGDQSPGKVVLVDDTVSILAPYPIHKTIDQRIIKTANHHSHRVTHQRMVEARQLPRPQMTGQDKDALALRREPQGNSPIPRSGSIGWPAHEAYSGHQAELSQQIPQVAVDLLQDSALESSCSTGETRAPGSAYQRAEAATAPGKLNSPIAAPKPLARPRGGIPRKRTNPRRPQTPVSRGRSPSQAVALSLSRRSRLQSNGTG